MAAFSLLDAVRYSKGLPHQVAAWEWLAEQLSDSQLEGFAERFRAAPPPPPSTDLVTAEQCQQIFGRAITVEQLADLNSCLNRFEINTPARIRHFMAQIAHESGGLRYMQELADGTAYEGRKDLGNNQPGDGPRFKGAGVIQLTGRENYEKFSRFVGDPEVMTGCSYVAQRYPFTSAGFWWHNNRANQLVDGGASCRRVSQLVNGRDPANGLEDREHYFAKATAVIGAGQPSEGAPASQTLSVPYFSQRDSGSGQAERMCFSSSCAMLVEAIKPGALSGGDDQYLAIVNQFGDTIYSESQIKALESLGIKARFEQHANFAIIEEQINRGIPVPCGFLHKGPVEAPMGGGHWLCVIGYTSNAVIVNDPYGDLDLLEGEYISSQGGGLQYSRKNFGRRWMVDASRGNAYAPGNGWAILAEP